MTPSDENIKAEDCESFRSDIRQRFIGGCSFKDTANSCVSKLKIR